MANFELRISIASELEQVWQVRVAIGAILDEMDFVDLDCLHVELAVAEAINNCIEHAYLCKPGDPIEVYTCISAETVLVEIIDNGLPLPLTRIEELLKKPIVEPTPDIPLLSNGRGLQIIRSTMDSVVFSRRNNRNVLTLRKTLRHYPADIPVTENT
jgi:serine/threonine-protein kinase RsbW